MCQFEKIKLVIWDLDETFWHGTITEGNVEARGRAVYFSMLLSSRAGFVTCILSPAQAW